MTAMQCTIRFATPHLDAVDRVGRRLHAGNDDASHAATALLGSLTLTDRLLDMVAGDLTGRITVHTAGGDQTVTVDQLLS